MRTWARTLLWPALVLASTIEVARSLGLPVDLPIDLPVSTFMARTAYEAHVPAEPDERAAMAVVVIDQPHFDKAYGGTLPLPRCQMLADIRRILALRGLETLAIDFDLSLRIRRGHPEEDACLRQLEALLLDPRPAVTASAGAASTPQDGTPAAPVRAPKVIVGRLQSDPPPSLQPVLADAKLEVEAGMVRRHRVDPAAPSFGEQVARSWCSAAPHLPACAGGSGERFDIAFRSLRHLFNHGQPLSIRSPDLAPDNPHGLRHIILGSQFQLIPGEDSEREDLHLTPVGLMPGAQVHAAIAADPYRSTSHVPGFLADILLGALLIGPGMHWAWERYFQARTRHGPGARTAYLWLLAMGLAAFALLIVLSIVAAIFHASTGSWISPAPVILGMAIEALVTTSVAVATHRIEHLEGDVAQLRRDLQATERERDALQAPASAEEVPAPSSPPGTPTPTPTPAPAPAPAARPAHAQRALRFVLGWLPTAVAGGAVFYATLVVLHIVQ